MKRGFLIALLFCLFSSISFSQWEEQSILPSANFFNDVFVLDNNYCWIVGQDGIVMKSFNNGFTWLRLSSQTTKTLNAVWFTNDQNGWLCGDNGTFKHTINGGFYWQESSLATENDLTDIFFINDNTGWVVGDNGLIYRTNDGGITWESQNSGTMHDLFSVHFINENEGWTAGYSGDILHTTNGGSSWTMQPQAVLDELFCIYFTDENHGWASGADGLLKTTDGGDTWETNQYQYGLGYRSVFFENASSGYLIINVGTSGILFYTNDGGESWESKNESNYTLRSIYFCEEGFGFAVGYPDVIVYSPVFGGGCGNLSLTPELTGLSDIHFLDSLNGWASSYGILHTNDGGNNWYTQRYHSEIYTDNIFFTSLEIGYASSYEGYIFKSIDGGNTWDQLENAPANYYTSICFLDDLNGWFSCLSGKIVSTFDGGLTWSQDEYQTGISSIFFIDQQHGWTAGKVGNGAPYGLVKRTVDGGATWNETQTYAGLNDVQFINQNDGWTAGQNGFFYITHDGGQNWEFNDIGYELNFQDINFINENEGWMCAGYDNSLILHSVDGGISWEEQFSTNNEYIMALDFVSSQKGWAVGGGIFHTDNGGNVGEDEHTVFERDQILISPNPCNDIISIHFLQSIESQLSINIFNLNGQVIKSANYHSLTSTTIDMSNIPSGLYLLQINIADKVFSKKILKQ